MIETLGALIAERRDQLPMWTVYDHPRDYPAGYLARLWLSLPETCPTGFMLCCRDVEPLRDQLVKLGFARLERNPEDDAAILETWV